MSSNDGSISFGKGRKVDFQGFNGIKKDDFNVEGNEKKKKLVDALFNKYNVDGANGDTVLDINELSNIYQDVNEFASGGKKDRLGKGEAAKFLESLGFKKGEYSREDLLEILNEINADEDSVEFAGTDDEGSTMIQYKADAKGNNRTEVYNSQHVLSYDTVENDETAVITQYGANGKTKAAEIMLDKKSKATLNTKYAADGTTVEERYRQLSPTVREDLDPANGNRVVKRTTTKAPGVVVTNEYEYTEDSVTETTTNPDRSQVITEMFKPDENGVVSKIVDNIGSDGKRTQTQMFDDNTLTEEHNYTYTSDGVEITHKSFIGGETEISKETRDANGNRLTLVNVDENGNIQDYEHTVNPQTDTWYGIVQAKYGITDHKTTMAIVHQLKANHNVARNAKTIPDKITLPATVKVGNTDYNLMNITQDVNDVHNVPAQIAIPADIPADQLPQKIAPLTAAQRKVTIPPLNVTKPANIAQADLPQNGATFPENMPKQINLSQYQFPVIKENAGKLVKQQNGQFYQYDESGRVTRIYANETDTQYARPATYIEFNNNGFEVSNAEYDNAGHIKSYIQYNSSGKAQYYTIAKPLENNQVRTVVYNMDNEVTSFQIYQYDNNNHWTNRTEYNPQGKICELTNVSYDNGNISAENYKYDNDSTIYRKYNSLSNWNQSNNLMRIDYDKKGKPILYRMFNFNETGNHTETIEYDAKGNFADNWINSNFTDNNQYTRQVHYNADGELTHFFDNYEYRDDGELVRYNRFTPKGKYDYHWEYRYGDINTPSRILEYDSKGRLVK